MHPPIAAVALTLALAAFAAGCGSSDVVARYCQYGAVSQAQLDGCTSHVSEGDVRSRQTHAAQYAVGDLDRCLPDAGPFCR